MGEILGLGLSHYPPFSGKDESMAGIFWKRLQDPALPPHMLNRENWHPELLQELGQDEGATAAETHRVRMKQGFARCMDALRDFNPDFCVIWGDDQYENFREDIVPPYCILAYDDMELRPWAQAQESSDMKGRPNYWNEGSDYKLPVRFASDEARDLTTHLLESGFDMAYAYKPLHHPGIAHSILNAILYLDFEREGFPWPVLPCTVNCYGDKIISHKGFVSSLGDIRRPDPPAPAPSRCFDLGAEMARYFRDSPYRVAMIASSSWSHAFLCDKTHRMMPDVDFDKQMYSALIDGDFEQWRSKSLKDLTDSGNQEMLNWMALMGAMSVLDRKPSWTDFVETRLFNSSKVAAVF